MSSELSVVEGGTPLVYMFDDLTPGRTDAEEARLVVLGREMTDRLLAVPATEVYDVD